jgi:hypothetical protein
VKSFIASYNYHFFTLPFCFTFSTFYTLPVLFLALPYFGAFKRGGAGYAFRKNDAARRMANAMAASTRYLGLTGSFSKNDPYSIFASRLLFFTSSSGFITEAVFSSATGVLCWLAVRELLLVLLAIYFSASGMIHSFFGTNYPFACFFFSSFFGASAGMVDRLPSSSPLRLKYWCFF